MHIKLTRNTRIQGEPKNAGDTVEVSDADGRFLVNRGHAVEASAPAPKKPKAKKATANKMADKEFTRDE